VARLTPRIQTQPSKGEKQRNMATNNIHVEARPSALDLTPEETAVVVVDMQQGFVGTGGAWDRMGVDPTNAQASIAPIARVLTASRAAGLSVVYLTMDLDSDRRPEPGGGAGYWTQERWTRWIAAGEPKQTVDPDCRLPPGVRESDILPELAPTAGDVIVLKPRWTGFYNTDLNEILKQRGITTLVFTGGTTSNCLEATLRDAFFRDYRCLLLADCTWEPVGNRLSRSNYEATLLLVELQYGWVSDSSALVLALSRRRTGVNAVPVS
jgi:ureidoacrylate peracid hydrolase